MVSVPHRARLSSRRWEDLWVEPFLVGLASDHQRQRINVSEFALPIVFEPCPGAVATILERLRKADLPTVTAEGGGKTGATGEGKQRFPTVAVEGGGKTCTLSRVAPHLTCPLLRLASLSPRHRSPRPEGRQAPGPPELPVRRHRDVRRAFGDA